MARAPVQGATGRAQRRNSKPRNIEQKHIANNYRSRRTTSDLHTLPSLRRPSGKGCEIRTKPRWRGAAQQHPIHHCSVSTHAYEQGTTMDVSSRVGAEPGPAPSTGTTIVACVYKGGVVLGADGRVSVGNYISNRSSNKIAALSDNAFLLRSGSAPDAQAVTDYGAHWGLGHLARLMCVPRWAAQARLWTACSCCFGWHLRAEHAHQHTTPCPPSHARTVRFYVDMLSAELGGPPSVEIVAKLVQQVRHLSGVLEQPAVVLCLTREAVRLRHGKEGAYRRGPSPVRVLHVPWQRALQLPVGARRPLTVQLRSSCTSTARCSVQTSTLCCAARP